MERCEREREIYIPRENACLAFRTRELRNRRMWRRTLMKAGVGETIFGSSFPDSATKRQSVVRNQSGIVERGNTTVVRGKGERLTVKAEGWKI